MFALDHSKRGPSGQPGGLDSLLHGGAGGGIYLEVAASVTTFLLAGRLYEARARRDAGDAMRQLAAAGARAACGPAADGSGRLGPVAGTRTGQRVGGGAAERVGAHRRGGVGQA